MENTIQIQRTYQSELIKSLRVLNKHISQSKSNFETAIKQELRFLVTQLCNYACVFCHGEGLQSIKKDLMTADDYAFLFNVGKQYFGFETTTLTGGEPLLRKDIDSIVEQLYEHGCKTTITTNGFLLGKKKHLGKLVKRVNVSLHSLNKGKYESLVQRKNSFEKVISGLFDFKSENPDVEIRLNSAIVDGLTYDDEQLQEMISFAGEIDASLKFVELYPSKTEGYVSVENFAAHIERLGFCNKPSSKRKLEYCNGKTKIGLTRITCATASKQGNPADYCRKSTDLFISPDAKIKPCRHNKKEIDFMPELKRRDTDAVAEKLLRAFNSVQRLCVFK